MDCIEIFSIIKDICISGAALTTAYVAYTGLEKWHKELRGKANFEVARELIKSVYLLRNELSYCRTPFISSAEFPTGYVERNSDNQQIGEAYHHLFSKRFEPVGEALNKFDAALLEAEALWGSSIKNKAKDLQNSVSNLRANFQAFVDDKLTGGQDFKDKEYAKKVRSTIFDSRPTENELTIKINNAVIALENEISPHLSRD